MRRRIALAALALTAAIAAIAAIAGPAAAGAAAATAPAGGGLDIHNETVAWDFLRAHGLTINQTAGVIGNLDVESYMRPHEHQIGGGPGRGIAQWEVGGRWDTYPGDNVVEWAEHHPGNAWLLHNQLTFTWFELGHGYGLDALTATTTIRGAVLAFQDDFEGCSSCDPAARIAAARGAVHRHT